MTIVQAIKSLAEYLQAKLLADKDTLQYKSTTVPSEYETTVPSIYCFTMPSSAIVDSYPAKCPSICITLDGRDDYSYNITTHLCISSASRSDKEMANPTETPNLYEMGEGDEYTTESDDDLIIESILFTDQIYNYIMNYMGADITEVAVEYPDVSLPDFPYAISNVSFKMTVDRDHINNNPYNDMY